MRKLWYTRLMEYYTSIKNDYYSDAVEICLSLLSFPSLGRKEPFAQPALSGFSSPDKLHPLLIVIIVAAFECLFCAKSFQALVP